MRIAVVAMVLIALIIFIKEVRAWIRMRKKLREIEEQSNFWLAIFQKALRDYDEAEMRRDMNACMAHLDAMRAANARLKRDVRDEWDRFMEAEGLRR